MSKLGCICGYTIPDNTGGLPYKAALLKDARNEAFFDWVVSETQSYVVAAQLGQVRQWLLDKGYPEDYANLELDHGNVLHDHIHSHYLVNKRDVYECLGCGRIHIETTDNCFVAYAPDGKAVEHVLALREDGL